MMMPGWGMGGGGFAPRRFEEQYHCYSVAYADKAHLEVRAFVRLLAFYGGTARKASNIYTFVSFVDSIRSGDSQRVGFYVLCDAQRGDKILLPPSAFDTLARLQVDYPMLFKLTAGIRQTHSGVLEFTAEEGCCYIPFWMMQNLLIEEGALITVTNVSLPKATFVKLQPQSVDFLEISNPRVVLEHALRNYSCVTVHDVIQIPYNSKNYHFELKDVQPGPAACIIETDCEVDFDAPVGYVEPERPADYSRSNSSIGAASSSMASLAGTDEGSTAAAAAAEEEKKPAGIRIVDGKIIRPDEDGSAATEPVSEMMAEQTGQTGVQKNAAIQEQAPEVDYWAVAAGDGARLDGKKPAVLKDATGQEVDVRQLRAEAAARRAAAQTQPMMVQAGQTVAGETVEIQDEAEAPAAPARRKNQRVGSKYSRLKGSSSAFQGSANQFQSDKK